MRSQDQDTREPIAGAGGGQEGRERLKVPCVVDLDNVHVVPEACLAEPDRGLGPEREAEIQRALGYALAWPGLKAL